jgi:VanZ family protein
MNKLRDFAILILYCALIYWLSAQHTLPTPKLFNFQDKVIHAGAYFVMSLLAWRYIRHFSQHRLIPLFITVGFCSLYGATDEWHQSFVVGRSSDVWDWLADTIGAGLAMSVLYKFKQNKQ